MVAYVGVIQGYKCYRVTEDETGVWQFRETTNNATYNARESSMVTKCKRVEKIEKIDANNTKIIFDNKTEIIVDSSYRTIENQLSRASRLDLILRNHKNS